MLLYQLLYFLKFACKVTNIFCIFAPQIRIIFMKLTKNKYLLTFVIIVALLALVRLAFEGDSDWTAEAPSNLPPLGEASDTLELPLKLNESEGMQDFPPMGGMREGLPHRINGVTSYHVEFPDSNDTQLTAARQWGVTPVRNRQDAERRMKELVYVGASPYYHIDPLYSSIPYLVPRASVLLHDIGRAFQDSLYVKGVPLHRIIVTSVLRTEEDVARLRRGNGNATENSCHLYGTTVDICYNRYQPITREVRNDTLKWVLSEVLRDMRRDGRCYIKHEVKQGCFHLTVR